jgi:hypothetical protein
MYDWSVLITLTEAADKLSVNTCRDDLIAAFNARSRLDAALSEAVQEFDDLALWECDGATSMVAWLKAFAGLSGGQAAAYVKLGNKLKRSPVTAAAFANGSLSRGQVDAVCANIDPTTDELWARHEAALVPTLVGLTVADTVVAMQEWKARAKATLSEHHPQPDSATVNDLHHSQTLDGVWATDGTFCVEDGALVATALRVATTKDAPSEPRRGAARKRADALVDVCRFFLDHQDHIPASRNRPHLNVVVKISDGEQQRAGELIDGTQLSQSFVDALTCDATIYRMLLAGDSTVIDYGTGTRAVSPPLWNALLVRDRHCRFPGCDRPPQWCEGHHGVYVTDHGHTNPWNMAMFCSRHHHLLHKDDWSATVESDGTVHITGPDGLTRTTRPPGRLC